MVVVESLISIRVGSPGSLLVAAEFFSSLASFASLETSMVEEEAVGGGDGPEVSLTR